MTYKVTLSLFLMTYLFMQTDGFANSPIPTNAAIFVVNQVSGSNITNQINDIADSVNNATVTENADGVRQIVIPILQDDGTYQNQTITTQIVDGVRQITLENTDGVQVINDVGNALLELTPDQIKVSENVTCNIKAETCTIKPFVMVINDRVLTADQMVVGYKENENLVITGGEASNLKLTGENSQTSAGDSTVQVSFAKEGATPTNPITATQSILDLPNNFSDQQYMRIDLSSSKLNHSVRNPNDPTQMKDQWGVKDGGVSTSLVIDRSDNLNIHFNGVTEGGFYYDSDPFSERSVNIETSAPIGADLVITDSDAGTMSTLSLAMKGENNDGSPATATVVDSRKEERTDRVTATGSTFLNISTTAEYDGTKPQTDGLPVAFELGTEKLEVVNTFSAGQENTTTVTGLVATGSLTPGTENKEVRVQADGFNFVQEKEGEARTEAGAEGDVRAYVYEDDSTRLIEGMANHAYYNNGGTVVDLSGGVAVRVTDFKKQGEDSYFDGRPVSRDAVIVGQNATLRYDDSSVNVDGGFAARQINFADNGSKITIIEGGEGKLTSEEYGVDLNQDFRVVAIQDSKGDVKAAEVTTGEFRVTNASDSSRLNVINSNTRVDIKKSTETREETLYIRHASEGIEYRNGDGNRIAQIGSAEGQGVIADDVKYGSGTFKDVTLTGDKDETTGKSPSLSFVSVDAAVYVDESDPNNRVVEGLFGIENLNAEHADYKFNVVALDEFGNEGKFQIYYLENEHGRKVEIYGEDGKRVQLNTEDAKNGDFYQVLFDAAQYIETDEFRAILATNVSGTIEPIDRGDDRLTEFNLARIEGMEKLDGSFRQFALSGGELRYLDGSHEARVSFDEVKFTEVTTIDQSILVASAQNGIFDYKNYGENGKAIEGGDVSQSASITFGDAIFQQMETNGENRTTIFSANDINIVAVDYEKMLELDGKIGSLNFFEDSKITAIEANELKDFRIEDKDNKVTALMNGEKVVLVRQRDETGKEVGSYLLIDSAALEVSEEKNGINANLRVGVFEYFRDELTGQNLFLDVDASGKISINNENIPFEVKGEFSAKMKNVTEHRSSYVSDDGATVSHHFAIKAIDDSGSIDHLTLSAGPEFLQDAISLKAKGGEGGGKELSFTFHQDKRNGTYYIRAEFKEGDKVQLKLFPFTLESKKIGNDAIADLLISPKGQNYLNHLEIITGVIDTTEITSWLEISDGGMLVASTPTLGGVGIEIMYQDQQNFFPALNPGAEINGSAVSLGAGVVVEGKNGAETSVGMMLTGDSEIGYQTNGVFKVFGFDMGKNGRIPATANIYAKRKFADGDVLYGGLSFDMTTLMVDTDILDRDASYYDGGRSPGSFGASVGYKRKIGERTSMTFAVGANENFSNPSACLTFSFRFGGGGGKPVRRVTSDTFNAIRRMGYD